MKKILVMLMVCLTVIAYGAQYDENHSEWYNSIKVSKKNIDRFANQPNILKNKKSVICITHGYGNVYVSFAYAVAEMFKIWTLSNGIVDEELKDLNTFATKIDSKYDSKNERIVFEYKSKNEKHYSGYMVIKSYYPKHIPLEKAMDDFMYGISDIYLYNPLESTHSNAELMEDVRKTCWSIMFDTPNNDVYNTVIEDEKKYPIIY